AGCPVPGCFCYPIRFFVHIWPLNQAVFGLAVSLPENNCLALIRTRTGFPTMTEISGIPAYNPFQKILCKGNDIGHNVRKYTQRGKNDTCPAA
ncbi:hypothetical protein, partial [Pseudomonas savastanoi]|uniref:hypothetical protein n=1 Tax=Pseudomonas savastanoi TaxID=29438 RepID=UPI001C809C1B